jgi:mannosyltransferase
VSTGARKITFGRPPAWLLQQLAVFLLALLPRLADLGRRPFWYDEVIAVQRASLPLPALISSAFSQHHLPTYFLLIAPFAHHADPQFWVRLPSAIFGALSVMLVFRIATNAAGLTAGIAAALILGLSPTEIAYSQEARSYALVMCLILVALNGLTCLVLSADRAALPWPAPDAPRAAWLQLTFGTIAAFCTLGDSLPWLFVTLTTAAMLIARTRNRHGMLRNFLIMHGIALGTFLPLYATMLFLESRSIVKSLGFIPASTAPLIWYDIESIYLNRIADFTSFHFMAVSTPSIFIWAIGIGLAAACLIGIWHLRRNPALLVTLLLAFLVLPGLFSIASLWRPMLLPRYLLWSAAPFAIFAGIGIKAFTGRLSPPTQTLTLALAGAFLLINLLPFYRAETKPRWDIATQIMAAEAKPGDVFYFYETGGGWTMRYYLPENLAPYLITDWGGNLGHALQAQAQGHRVWAIYGDSWQTRTWKSMQDFRASLTPLGNPATTQRAGSRIYIWRYDPPAPK